MNRIFSVVLTVIVLIGLAGCIKGILPRYATHSVIRGEFLELSWILGRWTSGDHQRVLVWENDIPDRYTGQLPCLDSRDQSQTCDYQLIRLDSTIWCDLASRAPTGSHPWSLASSIHSGRLQFWSIKDSALTNFYLTPAGRDTLIVRRDTLADTFYRARR